MQIYIKHDHYLKLCNGQSVGGG